MRLLASGGIFREVAPAAFVSTDLADGLRSDRVDSVRYMAMLQGSDGLPGVPSRDEAPTDK